MTATQPYRGRHWAPDDEPRNAANADTATEETLAAAPDEAPEPVLVAAPAEPEQDDTHAAPAADEAPPAPRKRKLFALRGGKAR